MQVPLHQEKFKRLVHAYSTLKDPAKRAAYDVTYERNRREQKSLGWRGSYGRRLRGASSSAVHLLTPPVGGT